MRSGWVALGVVIGALATSQPWVGQGWLGTPPVAVALAASWIGAVIWQRREDPGSRAVSRSGSDARLTSTRTPLPPIPPPVGPNGARTRHLVTRATLIAGGVVLIGARLMLAGSPDGGRVGELPSESGPFVGTVESIGSPKAGQRSAIVRIDAGDSHPQIRLAAQLPRFPAIGPADRVRLSGTIEAPGADSYGDYLRRIGIDGSIRSRSLERLDAPPSVERVVSEIRSAAGDALSLAIPEPEAGLAAGIVVGLRDRVDRDLATAYTTAGLSHVIAISGWNIAIVAALIGALLRRWPRRRRAVAALLTIGLYTILTGASASVVRAAFMAVVTTAARETGRSGSAAAALAWAAIGMLMLDPSVVGDAGFQLSALATAGLIAWGTPLSRFLASWRGGILPGWLAEGLGISLAAQAATLPVVLLAFGRLALLSPVVNLVVVPLVPGAMAGAAVAMLGGFASLAGAPLPLAGLIGLPGWIVLALMDSIVRTAAALPFASVTLGPPWNAVAAAGAVVGVALLTPTTRATIGRAIRSLRRDGTTRALAGPDTSRQASASASARSTPASPLASPLPSPIQPPHRLRPQVPSAMRRLLPRNRRERAMASALALVTVAVVVIGARQADGRVHVTVLDVGQGDAILVEGERGGRMLIDGGPDPTRLAVVLDARLPPWDRRIDLLVLSHPHEDHVAGLGPLLDRYRVRRVVEPGMIGPGPGYRAWAAALSAHGISTGRLSTGDQFALDGIAFRVLWPDPGAVPRTPPDTGTSINNVSIVLLGEWAGHRVLLMGDVEQGIDPILLSRGVPSVDLLKVAHHGSRTASTAPFLAAVHAQIAVVSAGLHNPYGHPAPATIDRLKASGAEVWRTDLDGTTSVTLDAHGLTVTADHRTEATASGRVVPALIASSPAAPRQIVVGDGRSVVVTPSSFGCGIPLPAVRVNPVTVDPATANRGYDPPDDRPRPSRSAPPPAVPRSALVAPSPLARGRRNGRVAGSPDCRQRNPGGPGARRVGGIAARCRQAAAPERPGPRAPPRRWLGRVADPSRVRGVGALGCQSSGHAARE